jgi:L-histidine Nalpha-methyltransferase
VDLKNAFLADVLSGLNLPQKSLPSKYFYDARGSELFEAITALPEYYLTRAEAQLLAKVAPEIAQRIAPDGIVYEFGSGSSAKTPLLLNALKPNIYVPIDVSQTALDGAVKMLQPLYPFMDIKPELTDFTHRLELQSIISQPPVTGFFPGSTIGNFDPSAATHILREMRASLGPESWLVLGLDQCTDPVRLLPAYNDAAGVTAAFNINVLNRINRELDGTIPVENFAHDAIFNATESRIEMHLKSVCNVEFTVANQQFHMRAGSSIHTENSYKYPPLLIERLVLQSGWSIKDHWVDAETGFAIYLAFVEQADAIPDKSKINRYTL